VEVKLFDVEGQERMRDEKEREKRRRGRSRVGVVMIIKTKNHSQPTAETRQG
jgi:hypothetical protein